MNSEIKEIKIKTKDIKLGNGLRLTESNDMGIFIHYKSESGSDSGSAINSSDIGYLWATELLSKVYNK